jgi:TPP-dependent pyruvate/acetoin dehydrogenase alpha subunit
MRAELCDAGELDAAIERAMEHAIATEIAEAFAAADAAPFPAASTAMEGVHA